MKKLSGPFVLATILAAHIGLVIATEESYTFRTDDASVASPKVSTTEVSLTSLHGNATANTNQVFSITDSKTQY
jgi:hypothetical protein